MWSNAKYAAFSLLSLGAFQVHGIQFELLPYPEVLHEYSISPSFDANARVEDGNGVVISPDSSSVVVTSVGATVTSLSVRGLNFEWQYSPLALNSVTGDVVRSHSRVVFTSDMAETPYMVYSVVVNENTTTPVSHVIALDMNGDEIWISEDLPGIVAGDPVISEDGAYVFVTHNVNDATVGTFTQLSSAMGGTIYFSSTNSEYAFSAPAIYHSPAEGNYVDPTKAALLNTNDMIMFAAAPASLEGRATTGNTFVFQMPMEYDGNVSKLEVLTMGEEKGFLSYAAPALVNDGYSAYFAATRSQFWCWVNEHPEGVGRFNLAPSGRAMLTRNDEYAITPSFATPAVSSGSTPSVFGGSAYREFVQMDYLVNVVNVVDTMDYVMTEAVIDPLERCVYYMESSGVLHSVDFDDISIEHWNISLGVPVAGEIAVLDNGNVLVYADELGGVTSLNISDITGVPERISEYMPSAESGINSTVKAGNGVVVTPDSSSVIVTTVGGTVTSLSVHNLEYEWEYNPLAFISVGVVVRSHSRVVFTSDMTKTPYMVYSVVVVNENTSNPVSHVIALDMNGDEIWISEDLPGIVAGDPVISKDGAYVFVTHNVNDATVGTFTQLSSAMGGTIYFSSTNSEYAFSAPAIYHSPAEGNYVDPTKAALLNTNDMIMFAAAPVALDGRATTGNTFVFQMPMEYDGNVSKLEVLTMGEEKGFLSYAAPALVNDGYSAYFAATRSQFWCWVNEHPEGVGRFNLAPSGRAMLTRNDEYAITPSFATPAVSSGSTPSVFGGSAYREFVQMDYLVNVVNVVDTMDYVMTEAVIDPLERCVYYMESSGVLHSVDFDDISIEHWNISLGVPVAGEIAVLDNGNVLVYADELGQVIALKVVDFPDTPSPTRSPTASLTTTSPSTHPTTSPTTAPTTAPTPAPTPAPSIASTGAPIGFSESPSTLFSTSSPIPEDTVSPITAPPTMSTSSSPTDAPHTESSAASYSVFLGTVSLVAFMLFL